MPSELTEVSATDHQLAEAYAACLHAMENGGELEAVLAQHLVFAEELRPLLRYAQVMQNASRQAPTPTAPALRASRLKMLQRYEAGTRQRRWITLAWWRAAFASGMAVVILVVSGYGIVQASAPSLPGEALYPIKRTAEQVRLWLIFDTAERQRLESEFEAERLEEVRSLNAQGRLAEIEFKGRIEAIAPLSWQIAGLVVQLNAQTQIEGPAQVGALAEVHGRLQADGSVLAEAIDIQAIEYEMPESEETAEVIESATAPPLTAWPSVTPVPPTLTLTTNPISAPSASPAAPTNTATHTPRPSTPIATPFATELEFSGRVQTIVGNVWRIADWEIVVTANTELNGDPQVGHWVEVHAIWHSGQWEAHQIERHDEPATASISSATVQPSLTPGPSETREPTEPPESTESPEPTEPHDPSKTPRP